MSKSLLLGLVGVLTLAVACGGGSGSSSAAGSSSASASGQCAGTTQASQANNVTAIVVDGGPLGNYSDAAFADVTLCVPGTSNCQTIGHVLVDTGSEGLRILSSAADIAGSPLSLSLTQELVNGSPVVECAQFLSFVTWGPVVMTDVKIAGETASDVPIQLVGLSGFPDVPLACTNAGTPAETVGGDNGLGSNGILGIGPFPNDCGAGCTEPGAANPGLYYTCATNPCQVLTLSGQSQEVQNPVSSFPKDNNGTIVELPALPAAGAASVSGALVFGIGTQSNNGLNGATILTLDKETLDFTTSFKGVSYSGSFIDSGSNGLFFLTTAITGIPECKDENDFYCPASTEALTATNLGVNGDSKATSFSVANFDNLNGNFNAFNDMAGPNAGSGGTGPSFDWGLPFFFGCNVFTGIETTTAAPYFAY